MTTKADTKVKPETLTDLVFDWLLSSGNWRYVNAPHLAWLDLRRAAMGDTRACTVGDAVTRQLSYEASGR